VAKAAQAHEVRIIDGRFTSAECTCGWRSAARRSRPMVRNEARDHSLLYADGRLLVVGDLRAVAHDRPE
jgi:hypothetical protein